MQQSSVPVPIPICTVYLNIFLSIFSNLEPVFVERYGQAEGSRSGCEDFSDQVPTKCFKLYQFSDSGAVVQGVSGGSDYFHFGGSCSTPEYPVRHRLDEGTKI